MKKLYEVVRRSTVRDIIKNYPELSYEKFKIFVKNESTPESVKFKNTVYDALGEKAYDAITAFCDTVEFDRFSDDELKSFYDDFMSKPAEKVTSIVGAGQEGAAYHICDNKIVKVFYNGIPSKLYSIYNIFAKHHCKKFPIIYHLNKNWVIMESLNTDEDNVTDKQWEMISALSCVFDDILYNCENRDDKNEVIQCMQTESATYQEDNKVRKWMNEFVDEVFKLGLDFYGLDAHEGNFGVRKNGDIVLFDPYWSRQL